MSFARFMTVALASLAISPLSTSCAVAQAIASAPKPDFVWSSTGKNVREVADELSMLYLGLFNTGGLTVQIQKINEVVPIENILRENTLIIGPVFTVEIESVICDLNTHLCNRERAPRRTEEVAP